ncbi:putative GTPase [Lacunisphaera limnophila]|uniref:Putative GTPase n=1 Tax=Lacunisphaera limnophila TaxID=1838286 RepID=A0A1D8AVI4_9BACT|nr:methylmalonyl Co-A mutase-associated GTPase MeaB [Lacunisphaera limnophila]AOS44865.1 putative GTPase [Lacunisphaera limnophila]
MTPPGTSQPDWVPPEGGDGFATKIVAGVPGAAADARPAGPGGGAPDLTALVPQLLAGERAALARAITLVESRAPRHRPAAETLLEAVAGRAGRSLRVGITGVPGAGKSTFIEALGMQLCEAGRRVAVLSVDPSSPVTGGSILGDKTRMERLARHPAAYIRPSPSGCELGGVARRTRETISLCEAAGFDTVLVETVGVGQSEVVVRGMVDCFVVLMIAGAGDELQGMKKGILELADVLVVNKADGENKLRAEAARMEFAQALHYLTGEQGAWQTPVLTCSAQTGEGVGAVWAAVEGYATAATGRGEFAARRRAQELAWLETLVEEGLRARLLASPAVQAVQAEVIAQVSAGTLSPAAGARRLWEKIAAVHLHKQGE